MKCKIDYKVGMLYKFTRLKFKVLEIDDKNVYVRFIGNMIPDHDVVFPLDCRVHEDVSPLPVGVHVMDEYYKRFLKSELIAC